MRQGNRRTTRGGQTLARRIGCVAVVVVLAGLVGNASSIRSATAVPSTPRAVTACDQPTCSLRDIASGAKVRVGTAVDASLLDTEFLDFNTGITDHRYARVLARQFNSLTTETQLKWTRVHPRPDHYDFGGADKLVAFAQRHHMQVRGHTLLWGTSVYGYPGVPAYVRNATPARMRSLVANHIKTVVGHFRGRINRWDVVNEPLQTSGTELDDTPFRHKLGDGYIADAFRIAHRADPHAELWLNEVLFNSAPGAFEGKAAALLALVDKLLAQHVPIHGVGLQNHIFRGVMPDPDPNALTSLVQQLGQRGLDVAMTELDVKVVDQPDRFADQAGWYGRVIDACLAVTACREITFWGFTDRFDWQDDIFGPGVSQAHIFDRFYQPKPAYFAARDQLLARQAATPRTGP